MNTVADLEIAELRRAEAREQAKLAEFERLLREVWPHYACNFLLGDVPDRCWVDACRSFMNKGMPPRDRKGWVVVSLATLRELAGRLP